MTDKKTNKKTKKVLEWELAEANKIAKSYLATVTRSETVIAKLNEDVRVLNHAFLGQQAECARLRAALEAEQASHAETRDRLQSMDARFGEKLQKIQVLERHRNGLIDAVGVLARS